MDTTSITNKQYCVSIDGSEYSDMAFNLVFNELFQKNDKITVVHITNPAKSIPFACQADTILNKYQTILIGKLPKTQYSIIIKQRDEKVVHALQQVNNTAVQNNCSVLVMGSHGHKENKQKNEVSKGINFIINNIKIPTIIVKESTKRKDKDNGAFTWLVSIDKAESRSFKAFEFSTNYLDHSKDRVIGLHFKTGDYVESSIQEYFEKLCKEKGILNYSFDFADYEKNVSLGKQIANYVNFNNKNYIDFLVVGHNPNKKESPAYEIIQNAQTNVLFYS